LSIADLKSPDRPNTLLPVIEDTIVGGDMSEASSSRGLQSDTENVLAVAGDIHATVPRGVLLPLTQEILNNLDDYQEPQMATDLLQGRTTTIFNGVNRPSSSAIWSTAPEEPTFPRGASVHSSPIQAVRRTTAEKATTIVNDTRRATPSVAGPPAAEEAPTPLEKNYPVTTLRPSEMRQLRYSFPTRFNYVSTLIWSCVRETFLYVCINYPYLITDRTTVA
jgi:hypothetical protein